MNEKAPDKQRLNLDSSASDYTNFTTNLKVSQKDFKTFVRQSRKWAARGYYSTPSEAMKALLECTGHV